MSGYVGVEGNKRVDEGAKDVAERPDTWRCPERFVSLVHVSYTIKGRKWMEVKH